MAKRLQVAQHLFITAVGEHVRMPLTRVTGHRFDKRGIQIIDCGSRNHIEIIRRLVVLFDQPIDLIGGHMPVAVARADERAVMRAERGDITRFEPRLHLIDPREHQIGPLERAGDNHRAHHRGKPFTRLAERLLHGARVEPLDRREPVLLRQAENNPSAGAVRERGQRLGDGRGHFALAFLDLALLGVIADDAHQTDELGHRARVTVHKASLRRRVYPVTDIVSQIQVIRCCRREIR